MKTGKLQHYHFRPATLDDLPRIGELENLTSLALRGVKTFNADRWRTELTMKGFDLEGDTLTATLTDGTMVAYCDVWCVDEPYVKQYMTPLFHPEVKEDQALVDAMMDWILTRAQENIQKAPEGTKVTLGGWLDELDTWGIALLEGNGYVHQRNFARMRIDLDEFPEAPVWPEGLRVKSWELGVEDRAIYDAKEDAFRDHWGFVEGDHDEGFANWMQYRMEDPHFKPELSFLVMDGGEIAALSLCRDRIPEDEEIGEVGTLGVRRAWRKKGLGLALLRHSFRALLAMGKKAAVLYVDTDSLTNAFRLYEKAGMHRDEMHGVYEYLLRDGEDKATRTLK